LVLPDGEEKFGAMLAGMPYTGLRDVIIAHPTMAGGSTTSSRTHLKIGNYCHQAHSTRPAPKIVEPGRSNGAPVQLQKQLMIGREILVGVPIIVTGSSSRFP
jgi:hypothetical protein